MYLKHTHIECFIYFCACCSIILNEFVTFLLFQEMESILNNPQNAQQLLDMTAGKLLLFDKNAVCVDIMSPNGSAWFLQEDTLKGKNLFKLIPPSTYKEIAPNFQNVLEKGIISSQN